MRHSITRSPSALSRSANSSHDRLASSLSRSSRSPKSFGKSSGVRVLYPFASVHSPTSPFCFYCGLRPGMPTILTRAQKPLHPLHNGEGRVCRGTRVGCHCFQLSVSLRWPRLYGGFGGAPAQASRISSCHAHVCVSRAPHLWDVGRSTAIAKCSAHPLNVSSSLIVIQRIYPFFRGAPRWIYHSEFRGSLSRPKLPINPQGENFSDRRSPSCVPSPSGR